ncbi:Signal transduction histidine kinase [Brevibacterium sp. Mu109]|uniref:sensor histidine kinase n=1 Tax=Brevibacterium sp. Mu109 TaxID=1255669 RepID=UPI000C523856|nr:HAMP domain-containing sensor histidine kinase [Brevibacterium sp. Mu109]SMX92960.1 Signal transduction histidine kinase [Brevibacterium sp. Mu109]
MNATTSKRRWGFRTRLTALIAVVFVAGGVALLGVQYFLVQGLFDTAIDGLVGCSDENGVTVTTSDDAPAGGDCAHIPVATEAPSEHEVTVGTDGAAITIEQTTMLSQEVLSGLLLWSIVTLLVFTLVAVVAASWLSKRSFARIGQITDTTKRITRNDLHQRLDLPGPADEIKELGDTIDTMLDGLEASFTQQERFVTNASHELRTPLTTTRAALEIPLEQGRVPEHLEPAIRRALDANQRSEQLISALLQLARTSTITPAHGPEPVQFSEIIERSLTEHEADIMAMDLSVTTELATASASADPVLLALAIDNLIDNAIRHNHRGGTLHLTTGMMAERPWVEISNSGPTMTEEEAAALIEPFNRGQSTRTATTGRSLGLGLTLVQNITESLDGTLTLTPHPDGGLTTRLTV